MAKPYKDGSSGIRRWKMKAAIAAVFGDIAVIDTNAGAGKGYCEFGREDTNLKPVGVFAQDCDNSLGTHGDKTGAVLMPLADRDFPFDNSAGGDLIAQADVGSVCFIAGRRTVAKTDNGGARSELGIITEVDAIGKVWVQIKPIGATL